MNFGVKIDHAKQYCNFFYVREVGNCHIEQTRVIVGNFEMHFQEMP